MPVSTNDRTILVIDDDPDLNAVVALTLTSEGYPVRCAANGAVALDLIQDAPPFLVVLDMHMPVLDGWGFAEAVRERGFDPLILVMSSLNAAQAARKIGAAGYLTKPFSIIALLEAVQALWLL